MPELKGKLDGFSLRVPTPVVSVVDLTVVTEKPRTVEVVNAALKAAAEGELKGILGYETRTAGVDRTSRATQSPQSSMRHSTKVVGGNLVKVLSWYDNEWGYSYRVRDLILFLVKKGL